MSQEKRKKRQNLMLIVVLMVVASTLTVSTIIQDVKEKQYVRFVNCGEALGFAEAVESAAEADMDIENWNEAYRYCMIYGQPTGT